HPCAKAWLVLDAVLHPFEPAVPPAKRLLQKADPRPRRRLLWIRVCPRADQPLPRDVEPLEQREDRVSIPVAPPRDHVDRAPNRPVVRAHRALQPIAVTPLMAKPALDERTVSLQASEP